MNDVEDRARAMTKADRRAYLTAAGWTRSGDTWFHPTRNDLRGDRGFYSLAAAIRTALTVDRTGQNR